MTLISLLLLPPVIVPNASYCQSLSPTDPYVYVLVWRYYDPHDPVSSAINSTYKQDLENAGFSVEIKFRLDLGNTSEAIREFLQNETETHEIAGALLVGDVPYANYKIQKETFPCDLYYMDLDGNWTDSDYDGIYDMHTNETGDLEPEIWVGRLYASTVTGVFNRTEDELLVNYFDKNHRFRTDNLTLPRRALAYIDDEFVEGNIVEKVNSSLSMIYGNETTLAIDPEITSAAHYKNTLNDTLGYEWLHLMAHGNHKKHAFKVFNTTNSWKYVYSSEIRSIDPHALFYNIMACNTADYAQTNYIGGSYLFADTYGLLVVGSTKLHHIWDASDFYEPVAKGKCIGQALKEWLEKYGELNPYTAYGLTILGDPTIRAPRVCDVAVTDVTASKSVVVQNSTISINVTVENKGNFTETFNVTLHANTTLIGNMTVPNLQPLTTTILTFVWNTTGVAKGNYRISATAVLPVDNNPDDNTFTGSWVAVILKDDVAITNVIPSNCRVVQNSTISINVTVENKGNFTETFNVTLHANTTLIGNMTVPNLQPLTTTILTFVWNTTGVAKGNYRISATAVLPVDNDPSDNLYTDGWVAVIFNNDIAVISVTAGDNSHDEIEVYSGWDVNINVNVRNEGISLETFNITVYADVNTTVIGTQTNITLAAGNSTTINFTWITTGVPTCRNYTISAYVHPVSGETDIGDNTCVDGEVYVRICGDVNGNGIVDLGDVGKLDLIYSLIITSPYYPPYMPDINNNGGVDLGDVGKLDLIYSGIL